MRALAQAANELGVGLLIENIFPGCNVARYVRIAVLLPIDTSEEHKKARSTAEDSSCSIRVRRGFVEGFVDVFEPWILRKVFLLVGIDTCHRIKICGQPTVILSNEMEDEISRCVRVCSDEFFPAWLSFLSSRQDNTPRRDLELTSIEVEERAVGEKLR